MGKYLKAEKANDCRKEIYVRIEQYVVQDGEAESNSGQLKFLKGLLIRNLAVSSRVRVRKDGFLKYVRDTLRFYHNDEVIAFMDCEKNMEAFLQSPYCEDFYYYKLFKPEYGFPPFLLLQRTQEGVERAMMRYLSLPSGLEACDEKKGDEMEKNKLEAYVEWLYSIALYEIFLRNFFDDIDSKFLSNPKADSTTDSEEEKELMRRIQELRGCRDLNRQKEMAKEMADYAAAYMDKFWKRVFGVYYLNYFFQHLMNLYAMMRIIVLIEYVNINVGREEDGMRKKEDIEAFKEAQYWKKLLQECLKESELFAETGRNRNLNVFYTELNRVYRECRIFPDYDRNEGERVFWEETKEAVSDLKQYIGCLRDYTVDKRPPEIEKKLWKIEEKLSAPIWNAGCEIGEIASRAERAREKNRKSEK